MQIFIINLHQFDNSTFTYHSIFKSFDDAKTYSNRFKKGTYKSISIQKITASSDDIMFEILSESKSLVQRLIDLAALSHNDIHIGDQTIVATEPEFQLSISYK